MKKYFNLISCYGYYLSLMSYCLLGPLFELVVAKTSVSEVGGGTSVMQQL